MATQPPALFSGSRSCRSRRPLFSRLTTTLIHRHHQDIRIKPDVCGTGNPIVSACASGDYLTETCETSEMSGTSMATPAVAGMVALFREFILNDHLHPEVSPTGWAFSNYDTSSPSAALIKAMVINSAQNVTAGYVPCESEYVEYSNSDFDFICDDRRETSYYDYTVSQEFTLAEIYGDGKSDYTPDFHQGFGRVTGNRVIPTEGDFNLYMYDRITIAPNAKWSAPIFTVTEDPDPDSMVMITLVWTDPAASSSCAKCLMHDLDLEVTVNGNRVLPNLGPTPNATGFSGVPDMINNIEKVNLWYVGCV